MPKNISEDVVEQIRQRADIVDVISEYVRLEKKGRNYEGLCPFHNEKTPSFKVNREKQIFHCFGCSAGGDLFAFLMSKENLSFIDVVEKLAHRYGVNLPTKELTQEQKERLKKLERIFQANELAAKYFNYLINQPQGVATRKYLSARGIEAKEIEKFRLGFSLPDWEDFLRLAKSRGFSEIELQEAGLIVEREKKTGHYDRFRNRLMFTIYNQRGQPVGFGGRVLDDSLPKYLNTGETLAFNKRQNLYGLNWAGESIRQHGYAIIMEGYMDVIAAGQFGVENVVASLGTAFTGDQAKLLKRYTDKVVICYDSDTAGVKATLRGLDILRDEKCQVKVVSLPKGKDPDDFIRKEGKEAFLHLVNDAKSLIEYKLELLLAQENQTAGEWKANIFNKIKPDLLKVDNAIEKEEHLKLIAKRLEISEGAIREELTKKMPFMQKNGIIQDKKTKNRDTIYGLESISINKPVSAQEQAERQLFFYMITDSAARELIFSKLGGSFFTNKLIIKLIEQAQQKWVIGQKTSPPWILSNCETEAEKQEITKIFTQAVPEGSVKDKLINDCIQVVLQGQKQGELAELRRQLKEAEAAGDIDKVKKLLAEIQQMMN